jgi:hypothetical protein
MRHSTFFSVSVCLLHAACASSSPTVEMQRFHLAHPAPAPTGAPPDELALRRADSLRNDDRSTSSTLDVGNAEDSGAEVTLEGDQPSLPPPIAAHEIREAFAGPAGIKGIIRILERSAAAAQVQLRRAGEEDVVSTIQAGEAGEYTFQDLESRAYDLEAFLPNRGTALLQGVHAPAGTMFTVDIDLSPQWDMFTIRGRVVDAGGKAVAGARVQATTSTVDWGAPSTPVKVHTDEMGRYALTVVNFGDVRVSAQDIHNGDSGAVGIRDIHSDRVLDVQLRHVEASCAGRVVDESGRPTAGATVEAFSDPTSVTSTAVTLTAKDGSFRIACDRSRSRTLRARRGYAIATMVGSNERAELKLQRTAKLRVSFQGHLPVGRGIIRWIPKAEVGPMIFVTSAPFRRMRSVPFEGTSVEIDAVPAGDPVAIFARTDDGRTAEGTTTLARTASYEIELDLDRTSALRVRPLGRDGKLAPALACLDGKPTSLADCFKTWHAEELQWVHLQPGEHVVHLYPGSAHPWLQAEHGADRPVTLVPGETVDLGDVQLGLARGRVAGLTIEDSPSGPRVEMVFEDQAAARAGVRNGQILISVDGKAVRNEKEAHEALQGDEGTVAELKLRDGANEVVVHITREPFRM